MTTTPAVDLVLEQLRREVPGGIGTYCRGLVQGLGRTEAKGRVRAFASRPPSSGEDPLRALGVPVITSRLSSPVLTRLWDLGLPIEPWPRAEAVLHGTSFACPSRPGAPLTLMVHDLAWRRLPDAFPRRGRSWHERSLRRLARSVDRFVVPSELTASDLASAGLGISSERIVVIEEGVDHLAAPDLTAAAELCRRHGVDLAEPFVLSVGTLEPRKNLVRLLEGYGRARDELGAPLVLAGPSGWGGVLAGTERRDGVVLLGPVSPGVLSALYQSARCLVYVPLLEGFGLPVAEAMSLGTPVVATPSLPASGKAALEVDPSDPRAIADGLVAAATDDQLRLRLSAEGRRRVAELTWESTARRHVAIWEELAP